VGRRKQYGLSSGGSGQIPYGYLVEMASVAYASKRSVTIGREAQATYALGQPLILVQDGKLVPCTVQKCVCSGSTMTVTVSSYVSQNVSAVYYDTSTSYDYGNDPTFTVFDYHFDTSTLYDSSVNAHDAGTTGLTVIGGGGTLITSSPSPMFGAGCFSFNGSQAYGDLSFQFQLGAANWGLEGWFWDRPSGSILNTNSGSNWANVGFSGNYPTMGSYSSSFTITSSVAMTASAWNHVAWVRDVNNYFKIYVNGVLGAASASGLSITSAMYCLFGAAVYSGSWSWSGSFSGKVDELRFMSGYCPYNAPFTPPTKPFGPDFR